MRIPVGVAAGGQIIHWEPASSPHMLLVGPTGSGKTIFINSTIDLVAARGWRIDLLDPKQLSYRGYIPESLKAKGLPTWPGITRVATSEPVMWISPKQVPWEPGAQFPGATRQSGS